MIRNVIVSHLLLWTTDRAHVLEVIGASLSEPHTDEFAIICVCVYI